MLPAFPTEGLCTASSRSELWAIRFVDGLLQGRPEQRTNSLNRMLWMLISLTWTNLGLMINGLFVVIGDFTVQRWRTWWNELWCSEYKEITEDIHVATLHLVHVFVVVLLSKTKSRNLHCVNAQKMVQFLTVKLVVKIRRCIVDAKPNKLPTNGTSDQFACWFDRFDTSESCKWKIDWI